ncbi:hypothetical protein GCM10007418_19600 [Halopseudomonas salina]|uniref:Uncharacterized protein n=1 Tax=Halopseudomonas salina TaxID=1323744 RepID=A0ABQ1PPC0_9GAMM|nr:hypothetical protein GCM10007418_19600 [Halopseudomonas salina]
MTNTRHIAVARLCHIGCILCSGRAAFYPAQADGSHKKAGKTRLRDCNTFFRGHTRKG